MRLVKIFAALLLTAAISTGASALTYRVDITNQIPGGMDTGQPFSPPVVVVHDSGYSMFGEGEMSTAGLELVAEEGDPSLLQSEAESHPNVSQVVVGTGPFFDTQTLMIEADPGDLLSIAWMLGRTNDLISGIHDVALPATGMLEFMTNVYDAGTEENTGLVEHIPFYGNIGVGPDTEENISQIMTYSILNDPERGEMMWNFPPAGLVTITLQDGTPTETASWGAVKALYR